MNDVLLNAASLAIMIAIGYALKAAGLVKPGEHKLIARLIMTVTLPCALVAGFADFTMDASLYFVILLGAALNLLVLAFAFVFSFRKHNQEKVFHILNMPGYNIGCFSLPFIQTSLGPFGVIVTSMFDIGNSIMCTGTTYALASEIAGKGERNKLRGFLKKMLSSVPFDTYMLMLLITVLGIHLPGFIFAIAGKVGAANPFLCMLLIGMLFEAKLEKHQISHVVSVLSVRLASAVLFALFIYYYAPFSTEIKQVVVIAVFSPLPIIATIFTEKCGADGKLSGICNSLSIPISLAIMTGLVYLWK